MTDLGKLVKPGLSFLHMANPQQFIPGDFLIFQVESGYGLLRVLEVQEIGKDCIWHLVVYRDLFQDTETAEAAINDLASLSVERPHVALTDRAFESTQVSRLGNRPLQENELNVVRGSEVIDRSIRLLLGLR